MVSDDDFLDVLRQADVGEWTFKEYRPQVWIQDELLARLPYAVDQRGPEENRMGAAYRLFECADTVSPGPHVLARGDVDIVFLVLEEVDKQAGFFGPFDTVVITALDHLVTGYYLGHVNSAS